MQFTPEKKTQNPVRRSSGNSTTMSQHGASATKLQNLLDNMDLNIVSPDTAQLMSLLGKAYQKLENYEGATEYLSKAITMYGSLRSDHQYSEVDRAKFTQALIVNLNRLGVVYLAQNQLDFAESIFAQALEALNTHNNPDEAPVYAVNPELATTFYHFGLLYQALEDETQALESFLKAQEVLIGLDKKNDVFSSVHYQIGRIFWAQKKYEAASIALTNALSVYPEHATKAEIADICYYLGLIDFTQKHYDTALSFFDRTLSIYRKHSESAIDEDIARVLCHMGSVHAAQGNIEYAENFFEQAKETFGTSPQSVVVGEALHQMGLFYQGQNNYELAIEEINQALSVYRQFDDDAQYTAEVRLLLTLLGQLYLTQAKLAIATPDLELAETNLGYAQSSFDQAQEMLSTLPAPEDEAMVAALKEIQATAKLLETNKTSSNEEKKEISTNNLTPKSPQDPLHLQRNSETPNSSGGTCKLSATHYGAINTQHQTEPSETNNDGMTCLDYLLCCGLFKTKKPKSFSKTTENGSEQTNNPLTRPLNDDSNNLSSGNGMNRVGV